MPALEGLQDATRSELYKSPLYALEAMAMMRLLFQWVLSALSFMMIAKLLPGFHIKDFGSALGVAAVYGILHVVLYPVLLFVAFIPVLLSFGLFIFVINAFLLFLTSALLDTFQMDNMLTALIGAVVLTMLNGIWRWLLF
jgi:putative membrane protein